VDDDRLLSSLRRIAEPVGPAADFIDRLYESLADELGFHGKPAQSPVHWLGRRGRPRSQRMRVSLWLAAAVLLALALIGGVALVGAVLEDRKPPSVRNGLIAIGRDDGILLLDPTTGTTVRRLETPLPFVTSITWAPDGQQLAFNVEVDFDGNPGADPSPGGVWVMDVSEGTSKQLLHCGAGPDACGVAWSPDGSSLAVTHGPRLELIDPDSGEATVLENFRQGVFSPTWSPDSSRIAVSLFDGVLTSVSLDGSARITLSRLPDIGGAIWSPDGSTFAYLPGTEAQCPEASNAEECAGQYDITIMLLRLATNTPETLAPGGRCGCHGVGPGLGWSPDGTRLVLVLPPVPGGPTGGDFGLFVMNADGSDLRLLSDGHAWSPAWQPVH
jgi:hypothetical protein